MSSCEQSRQTNTRLERPVSALCLNFRSIRFELNVELRVQATEHCKLLSTKLKPMPSHDTEISKSDNMYHLLHTIHTTPHCASSRPITSAPFSATSAHLIRRDGGSGGSGMAIAGTIAAITLAITFCIILGCLQLRDDKNAQCRAQAIYGGDGWNSHEMRWPERAYRGGRRRY